VSEAQVVIATGLLGFFLVIPPFVALGVRAGFGFLLGNRADAPELPEWGNRAVRAQRNMIDTLLPFAVIMLGVQMAGVSNENTLFGAQLFFWGRLAHAVIYIAGIPYLRTVAFIVSVGGMFRVAQSVLPFASIGSLLS
jgi:uncharacterized MAPEG superfamily protein